MANELRIADTTGLTYTCEVREADGDIIGSAVSLTESGSTGRYYGDFPSGSASADTEYDLIYIQNSTIEATEHRYWNGSKLLGFEDAITATGFSTHSAADVRTEMDSNSTQLAALIVDTGTDIPNLIAALNDLSAAQVNAEVDTALGDYDGPTNAEMVAAFTEIKGATWATTDTLEGIRDRGDAEWVTADVSALSTQASVDALPTAAQNADAVWDEVAADHGTSGTFGADVSTFDAGSDTVTTDAASRTASQADVSALSTQVSVDALPTASAIATAVWSAVTRTLTTGGATAAEVWAYATRTLTSSANVTSSSISGSAIEITRAVTFTNQWTGLTIPVTWEKAYFTVKSNQLVQGDTDASVQLVVTNPADGGDGLIRLNGAATTASYGTLVVDQAGGSITATITDDATAGLPICDGQAYDLKIVLSTGSSELSLRSGVCGVVSTPTRAIA